VSVEDPRILIVSASIGGGHVAAGRALKGAFEEAGIVADHIDLLEYTAAPFRRLYRQAYFDLVRTAPDLVEWLGRRMDKTPSEDKSRQQRLRVRLTRMLSYELPNHIALARPDVVVHTHFLGAEILGGRLRRKRAAPPQVEVITDFFAHNLWLQPGLLRYYVATEEVAVHLHASGVEDSRIRVTGIPVDLRFAALPPMDEARAALGMASDRDVLLFMASGLDARTLTALLRELEELRWPLTTHLVCGRSPELQAVAHAAVDVYEGPITFEIHGRRDDIPLLMASSDLLVGKPGGLTSSEALAAGLPLAVVQPYPLQEEANANVLLEQGAAMRISPVTTFSHKLRGFFADPERRRGMREAARKIGRPDAARAVVASVRDELLGDDAGIPS
jgi:processive 1,2-diacylglycerol beta-glucosyltransferase